MMASKAGSYLPIFPDLKLYEEVIFLQNYFNGKWVVENVNPYYDVLVPHKVKLGRHIIWSNFTIPNKDFNDNMSHNERGYIKTSWFDLTDFKINHRKDQIIRNCVDPKAGLYIFKCAFKIKQETLLKTNEGD